MKYYIRIAKLYICNMLAGNRIIYVNYSHCGPINLIYNPSNDFASVIVIFHNETSHCYMINSHHLIDLPNNYSA